MKTEKIINCCFLLLMLIFFGIFVSCNKSRQSEISNTITITGKVTDFDGNPIDSSIVKILHQDFSSAYETYTDHSGYYKLKNIEKGRYMAMYVLRPKEYPRNNEVPKEDMRLEYWGWNIIADSDMVINPRYHKLELYGTTVFDVYGGQPGLFIYFRPMSLTKYLSYSDSIYINKERAGRVADISVKPENLKVEIFADDELLKINSIQAIKEYTGENNVAITGYIVQTNVPKAKSDKPYRVIRVVAENKEFSEKGENLCFYEIKAFK